MNSPSKPVAPTEPAGTQWRAAARLTAKDKTVLADIGETCARVPESSLPWLIEQEIVRPLDCTCPPGVPRVPDPACPVKHAEIVATVAGATAALDAPKGDA